MKTTRKWAQDGYFTENRFPPRVSQENAADETRLHSDENANVTRLPSYFTITYVSSHLFIFLFSV